MTVPESATASAAIARLGSNASNRSRAQFRARTRADRPNLARTRPRGLRQSTAALPSTSDVDFLGDLKRVISPRVSQPLYPIRVVAVFPEERRLSRRPFIELRELEQQSLLLLSRDYATREIFDAACQLANLRPRVLLESAAPYALIALAKTGYGVGVVYSTVRFPSGVRAIPIVSRGFSIGSRTVAAWNSQRSFAPYAEIFVKELAAFVKRNYPGREIVRRAPPLA